MLFRLFRASFYHENPPKISRNAKKNIAIYRISRYINNIAIYRISRYIAATLLVAVAYRGLLLFGIGLVAVAYRGLLLFGIGLVAVAYRGLLLLGIGLVERSGFSFVLVLLLEVFRSLLRSLLLITRRHF